MFPQYIWKMGKIIVYNSHLENHENDKNNFYIGRSRNGNPLGNPFTYDGKKSDIARFVVKTREESIEKYKEYFKEMYGKDNELTKAFDEIYEHYRNGEDIYLQCFCKPLPCHGDFLAEELQRKLLIEKINMKKPLKHEPICK